MDSLTHLVAGALTPLAFRDTPKRAAVVGFGIAAGELPDFDILFGTGPEALLSLHRGVTHALFWQPFFVLLVVIPFFIWLHAARASLHAPGSARGPGARAPAGSGLGSFHLPRMYLVALIAVCTHIYLDCMTTFGTQALLPFSETRVYFAAMFIVDPLMTVPMLILLVAALRAAPELRPARRLSGSFAFYSAEARKYARLGLAWVLLYPLAALGVNHAAAAWHAPALFAENAAAEAPGSPPRFGGETLILMTEPFSPFIWKAVIDEGRSYGMSTLSLLPGGGKRLYCAFAKPEPELYAALKRQHPIFTAFEEFAPLMVQSSRPASYLTQANYASPLTEYVFTDLRYIAAPDSFAHYVGRGDPMFVLEARVNESGALVAYRFLRNASETDTPWTLLE